MKQPNTTPRFVYVVIKNPGFDREKSVAEFATEAEALKYVLRHPHDGLDVMIRGIY